MSSQLIQSYKKQLTLALSFAGLMLLALFADMNHFGFLYGISFSLTSLFILLSTRLYGYGPGLLTAAVVYSLGIWLHDQPIIHGIGFLEAATVGLLMKRYRDRLFCCDVVFWFIIGIPLIYITCYKQYPSGSIDLWLIASIIAVSGMFNALFAEVIHSYFPLRKWSGFSTYDRRPHSFSKLLFHFSFGIIFVSFLLNIYMNSQSSFKEVSMSAKRLSINEVSRLSYTLNEWSVQTGHPTLEDQEKFIQEYINSSTPRLAITITNHQRQIIASSNRIEIGQTLNLAERNKLTTISTNMYLNIPNTKANTKYFYTWYDGYFVYSDALAGGKWTVFVNVPITDFQNYLFSKYFTHFAYLVGLALFSAFLSYLINRKLVQSLTRLTASTTDLPRKLKQMETVVWPDSSIMEIHLLISNFKHMSANLLHLFHESQTNRERLETQTYLLQQSEERLHQLAYYDMLTGLPNRLQFNKHFQDMILLYSGTEQPIAIMFADINRFKQINDTLGHSVGDILLQKAAERFEAATQDYCTVFRLGGDEFVFVGQFDDEAAMRNTAQSICRSFDAPVNIDGTALFLSVSVGISIFPQDGGDLDTIVRNADIAMYSAKEQGDGCYRFFKPNLKTALTEKMQLENGLHHALLENQFSLNYQPKINALTGELCGIEALIRWKHPELGMVPPDRFIPLAEQSGFIFEIDSWVFREACRQNKAWQDTGLQKICVSVNISGRHFDQGNLIEMIVNVLEETGLEAQYVSLELTESVFMQNMEQVIERIIHLRKLGIYISIDDFGTGYSSLNQLRRLPISDVKLDRSFISDIANDEKKSSIVKAIIELVHSMNMKVVAEGVETLAESQLCTDLQCDELQGYLFSKPLPPEEFEQMLRNQGKVVDSQRVVYGLSSE